jgi:hypothetical protein
MSYWNPLAEQRYNQTLSTAYTGALARSFNERSGIHTGLVGTGLMTRPGNSATLSLRIRGNPISAGGRPSPAYATRVVQVQSAATMRGG